MRRTRHQVLAALMVVPPATCCLDAQPVAQSSIVADFTTVKRVIPPYLFGQNLQTVDRGDFMLRRDGSVDQPLLDLLSELRITTLRFPGGTPADYFPGGRRSARSRDGRVSRRAILSSSTIRWLALRSLSVCRRRSARCRL